MLVLVFSYYKYKEVVMLEVLTDTAETVLKRRYYLKDEEGNCIEDYPTLCRRVAKFIASATPDSRMRAALEQKYFEGMYHLDWLPNTPALTNAGTDIGMLSACIVLGVEDSITGIFNTIRDAALCHKEGSGTGFSFSDIRAAGSRVKSTNGISSGPLSFIRVFNEATETIKQGSRRRGANLATLIVDHPDIEDFIDAKEDLTQFTNFNFSVGITDAFMEKVKDGCTDEVRIFNKIVDRAWRTGEPGCLFLDTINKNSPVLHLGRISSSNPCIVGDTLVAVADGRNYVPIKVLADEGCDVPVYCLDKENKLAIRTMVNPRKTNENASIYTVTIDNGHVLRVTANHKFTLTDGRTVEAKDLFRGDSLKVLSKWENDKGYIDIKEPNETKKPEHRVLASHFYGLSNDEVVHHLDHNRSNNITSNLVVMSTKEHTDYHMIGDNNPAVRFPEKNIFNNSEWQQKIREMYHIGAKRSEETKARIGAKTREWFSIPGNSTTHGAAVSKGIRGSQKFKDSVSKRSQDYLEECREKTDLPTYLKGDSIFVEKVCEECGSIFEISWSRREQSLCSHKCGGAHATRFYTEHSPEVRAKIGIGSKKYANTEVGRDNKRKAAIISAKNSAVLCGSEAVHNNLELIKERWDSYKDQIKGSNSRIKRFIRADKIVELFETWDNFCLEAKTSNHKVISVVQDGIEDVYNGTVEEFHNYFIGGYNEGDIGAKKNVTISVNCLNCGEIPLLPGESCNLASINLSKFIIVDSLGDSLVDWQRLQETVEICVYFLNGVIDKNKYPIPIVEEMTKRTRKIGLGIMGLHDILIELQLPYASEEGREMAAKIMNFIEANALIVSEELAEKDGPFPGYDPDLCSYPPRRNATVSSIQPTGTGSMIANCSSGCEPNFSYVMVKNVMDETHLTMVNPLFEKVAKREGFYSDELLTKVGKTGSVLHPEIPVKWQEILRTASDISADDHVKMLCTLQNNGVQNAISKSINMPESATREDVARAYMMAWEGGAKGLTVYRNNSRANQVLNTVGNLDKPTATVSSDGPVKQDLPDTLRARRYKLKLDDGENVYIIICFSEDGKPMEVFAKFPYDGRHEYREKSTAYTTVCRLVSLALRYSIPVEEVIKQLDKSSGSMMDLPAQLTKLLKTFLSETNSPYTVPCPECGEPTLVFEEGCQVCKSCGYSKCS